MVNPKPIARYLLVAFDVSETPNKPTVFSRCADGVGTDQTQ